MSLEGRVAVVTGGGRGIGAAAARTLARAGAAVVVSARSEDEIGAVAETIRSEDGRAEAIPCDVTDEERVDELARRAEEALGPVRIVVHAAGAATSAPLARTDLETWRRMLAVNATGSFLVTRAFLPGMVERGAGRIVHVASVAGLAGARYIAAYAASKHAVVGLVRSAAAEVAGSEVTVNAVCPGYVDTAMTRASVERISETTGRSRAEALDALLAEGRQSRLIRPGEVADAVAWLCGDDAGGVNGQAIVLDGGALLA